MTTTRSVEIFERGDELQSAKLLIQTIAAALVREREAVHVNAVVKEDGGTLELTVALEDLGKIIGKEGRTARSIRTILVAAGVQAHKRFALDIKTLDTPKQLQAVVDSTLQAAPLYVPERLASRIDITPDKRILSA